MKRVVLLGILVVFFIGCSSRESNVYIPNKHSGSYKEPFKFKPTSYYNTSTHKKVKLKPYKVLGKWYYPRYVNVGEVFKGISSWYGPNFHGKKTANGEVYNMYGYTAANKIMPLGTIVKVTNLNNNKSVIVRINDRGPFVKGRILDLSYAAGKKIGIDQTGTAPVEVVVLKTPYSNNKVKLPQNFRKKLSNQVTKTTITKKTVIKLEKKSKTSKRIQKNGKIKIQIGAFKNISGAKIFKEEFASFGKPTYIKEIDGKYKVFIYGFDTYQEAQNFKLKNDIKGFIVK